jgi:O-antigen ligase
MRFLDLAWPIERNPITQPKWLEITGYLLVLMYGLIKLPLFQSSKHLDTVLLMAGLTCILVYGTQRVRQTLPVWCIGAAVVAALATWAAGQISHPELIKSTPKIEHLATHFLFVVFAFWLMGSVQKTIFFWALAIVSVVIAPWWLGGGWDELAQGWAGVRINLGIHNSQHTSVVMGSALIAWLVFAKRMVIGTTYVGWRAVAWLIVFSILAFGFLASQTRAAYMGMGLVLAVVVIGLLYRGMRARQRMRYGALVAAILIVASFVLVSGQDKLKERFAESAPAVNKLLEGDWDAIPSTSLGIRLHSWRAGMEWIAEQPFLGLGRNGGEIVMRNTDWLQVHTGGRFGHMHNSAVEFLVRYGAFGLSIYLILMVWTTKEAHKAWKSGVMPTDFYVFFWLFFVFYMFVNMFESFMFYTTGILPFTVVMSGLLGFIWRHQVTSQQSISSPKMTT